MIRVYKRGNEKCREETADIRSRFIDARDVSQEPGYILRYAFERIHLQICPGVFFSATASRLDERFRELLPRLPGHILENGRRFSLRDSRLDVRLYTKERFIETTRIDAKLNGFDFTVVHTQGH